MLWVKFHPNGYITMGDAEYYENHKMLWASPEHFKDATGFVVPRPQAPWTGYTYETGTGRHVGRYNYRAGAREYVDATWAEWDLLFTQIAAIEIAYEADETTQKNTVKDSQVAALEAERQENVKRRP